MTIIEINTHTIRGTSEAIDALKQWMAARSDEVAELESKIDELTERAAMKKLTEEQAIIVSAYTGYLCCDFNALHHAVEGKLQRPVFTHQFGDKEFAEKISQAFRDDFLAICHKGEQQ